MANEEKQVNIADNIFDFIYSAAVHDATLQGAYSGQKAWIVTKTDEAKAVLKKHIEDIMSGEYIGPGKSQKSFDMDFLGVAKKICEKINDLAIENNGGYFSFGNAQKLINITTKYFFISTYNETEARAKFRFCHCPMDNILLEVIWKESHSEIDMDKSKFTSAWSKIDFKGDNLPKRYEVFQECVRNYGRGKTNEYGDPLYPIECDYELWNKKKS